MSTDEFQSDFLYARPSFLEGAARLFDFSGSLNTYNESSTPAEADTRAMYEDWRAVGHDLQTALTNLQADSRDAEPR
jgi:hypothetical protein